MMARLPCKRGTAEPVMKNDQIVRQSPEYAEGQAAFADGKSMDDCPHAPRRGFNASRYRWFTGWLEAQTENQIG